VTQVKSSAIQAHPASSIEMKRAICIALACLGLVIGAAVVFDHADESQPSPTHVMHPLKLGSSQAQPYSSDRVATPAETSASLFPQERDSTSKPADQKDTDEEASRVAGIEETRKLRRYYSHLLDDAGLTLAEKDAVIAELADEQAAATTTLLRRGTPIDENDRANALRAIVGDQKLRTMLTLERHLSAYGEAENIASLLRSKGAPLEESKFHDLLTIVMETQSRANREPASSAPVTTIEDLGQLMTWLDEQDRHTVELAVTALTPTQLRYLSDQYQRLSERRAVALEKQRVMRAQNQYLPFFYPTWSLSD
jgi:hypothetical protein